MNFYRKSIALFGFVIPLLIAAVVVGAFAFFSGKAAKSFDDKQVQYSAFQRNRQECLGLEGQITNRSEHVARWAAALREETASSITSNLKQVAEGISSKEFQQTAFSRPNNPGGFGSASAQRSSPVQLSFRSNFRSMQKVLIGLESNMPQLQLEELRIDRAPQASNLNFQIAYTAWEN